MFHMVSFRCFVTSPGSLKGKDLMGMKSKWVLLCVALGMGAAPAASRAQGYVGVSASLYQPEDREQERTEVYDLRAGYRIRPQLGFEWSLGRLHLTDTVPFKDNPTIPGIDF